MQSDKVHDSSFCGIKPRPQSYTVEERKCILKRHAVEFVKNKRINNPFQQAAVHPGSQAVEPVFLSECQTSAPVYYPSGSASGLKNGTFSFFLSRTSPCGAVTRGHISVETKNTTLQRSDREEEEEEEEGEASSPAQGSSESDGDPSSPAGAQLGIALTFEASSECVVNPQSFTINDLVKYMHPYCLTVCLEPGDEESEQIIANGGLVLEIVEGEEQGGLIAGFPELGILVAVSGDVLAESMEQSAHPEEECQSSETPGIEAHPKQDTQPDVGADVEVEEKAEERSKGQNPERRASGRRKKRKSRAGPGGGVREDKPKSRPREEVGEEEEVIDVCQPPPTQSVTSGAAALKESHFLARQLESSELQSTRERCVQTRCRAKTGEMALKANTARVAAKPRSTKKSCAVSQTLTEVKTHRQRGLPAAPQPSPGLVTAPSSAVTSAAVQEPEGPSSSTPPQGESSPPESEAALTGGSSIQEQRDPKPRMLSLEQYRLLRQKKQPAPVEKVQDQSMKWPTLPELPRELPPIPCLPEPAPTAQRKADQPPTKTGSAWHPMGPGAPPTPEALLVPPGLRVAPSRSAIHLTKHAVPGFGPSPVDPRSWRPRAGTTLPVASAAALKAPCVQNVAAASDALQNPTTANGQSLLFYSPQNSTSPPIERDVQCDGRTPLLVNATSVASFHKPQITSDSQSIVSPHQLPKAMARPNSIQVHCEPTTQTAAGVHQPRPRPSLPKAPVQQPETGVPAARAPGGRAALTSLNTVEHKQPGSRVPTPCPPDQGSRIPTPCPPAQASRIPTPCPPDQGSRIPTPCPPAQASRIPTPCPPDQGSRVPMPCPPAQGSRVPMPCPPAQGSRVPMPCPPAQGSRVPMPCPPAQGSRVPMPCPPAQGSRVPTPCPPAQRKAASVDSAPLRPAIAQPLTAVVKSPTEDLIQAFTSEIGIQASDLTSLLEQFEETQAEKHWTVDPSVVSILLIVDLQRKWKCHSSVLNVAFRCPASNRRCFCFCARVWLKASITVTPYQQYCACARENVVLCAPQAASAAVADITRLVLVSSSEPPVDRKVLARVRGPDLASTAGLTPPATPPHHMWKPLAPVSLLRKPKLPEGPKLSHAKAIQIIDPKPLPHSNTRTKLPSSPAPSLHSENPSFADHDYCLPGTEPACAEKGRRWNVKQQSSITIKPIEQRAPAGCPRKCAVQPLDHRTLSGSVLLSPDSSPCRLEADTASRDSTEFSSSRCFRYYSPEKSERGRARRRSRTRSSSSSESDSSGRVVYVGKIRSGMTRKELRERFSAYGEIEECALHFREEGLQKWGLNTYLYAPKDDYKHRMFWREMYSVEEAEQLITLISAAKEYGIEFIYAISPGLDITFSNQKEVVTLKRKLDQGRSTELIPRLKGVLTNPNCEFETNFVAIHTLATWYKSNMNGVRKDIVMSDSEDSTVSIQIKLENEGSDEEIETDMLYSPQLALKLALQEWLGEFGVPHLYNSRQVPHSGAKSTAIDVASLVTPNLGSSTTVSSIYQQPIMSQSTALSEEPIPLSKVEEEEEEDEEEKKEQLLLQSDEEPMEMVLEKQDEPDTKNVNQILTEIVKAKMTEELKPMDTDKESSAESKSPEMSIQEDSGSDIAPMQTDEQLNKEPFVPGPNEKPLYSAEALTLEDLTLLAELFYLPYEHGPKAVQMLKEFNWLRANSSVVSVNSKGKEPQKGRSTELIPRLKGVLTNPNCEFETNFVAIHTLATWYKSNMNGVRKDVVMSDSEDSTVSIQIKLENEGSDEEIETDMLYSPQLALKLALQEWLGEFGVPHLYNSRQVPHSGAKSTAIDVASLVTPNLGSSTTVSSIYQQPIMSQSTALSEEPVPLSKVEEEDEEEKKEQQLLQSDEEPMEMVLEKQDEPDTKNVNQILTEIVKAKMTEELKPMDTDKESSAESKSPEMSIQEDSGSDIAPMQTDEQLNKEPFVPGPNEKPLYSAEALTLEDLTLLAELFYLPYEHGKPPSCNVLRLDLISTGCRSQSSAQFLSGDQEPWAFRGGLAGEFQRLLPIDGANDLFYQPPPAMPTSKIYSIRPYFPEDEPAVYKICREMYNEDIEGVPFPEQPDLIGDRLVGGFLTLSPDYGFVLEDNEGICGYALGTVDVKPFVKKCKMSWIPSMQEKYNKPDSEKDLSEAEKMMLSFHEEEEGLPESFLSNFPSLIKVDIHGKVTDPSVAKSMMGCLLSSIKANGSHGAFCEVRQNDKRMLDFYSKLGCFEVAKMEGFPKGVILMGRSL
ncbi:UNVERIFIED_CONTAM: hypothetical protein FKN15_030169 [Acipenser sinensis]